jgi:hypothetical protein
MTRAADALLRRRRMDDGRRLRGIAAIAGVIRLYLIALGM